MAVARGVIEKSAFCSPLGPQPLAGEELRAIPAIP